MNQEIITDLAVDDCHINFVYEGNTIFFLSQLTIPLSFPTIWLKLNEYSTYSYIHIYEKCMWMCIYIFNAHHECPVLLMLCDPPRHDNFLFTTCFYTLKEDTYIEVKLGATWLLIQARFIILYECCPCVSYMYVWTVDNLFFYFYKTIVGSIKTIVIVFTV